MTSVLFAPAARKALERLQQAKRDDVRRAIARYAADPFAKNNNVSPLTGRKGGYRIRVGDLRVICELTRDTLLVLDVLPRGEAYTKKNWR